MKIRVSIKCYEVFITLFNGEKYEFWSKRFKEFLVSLELSDVVSDGNVEEDKKRNDFRVVKEEGCKGGFI